MLSSFPFLLSTDQVEDAFLHLWRNSIRGDQFSDQSLRIICDSYSSFSSLNTPMKFDPIGICSTYSEFNWEDFVNYFSEEFNEYLKDNYGDDDSYNLQTIIDIQKDEIPYIIKELRLNNLVAFFPEKNVYLIKN